MLNFLLSLFTANEFCHTSVQQQALTMPSPDSKEEVDLHVRVMVTFIVVVYTIAGVFLCRECWPMVKDIYRSYYPDKPVVKRKASVP